MTHGEFIQKFKEYSEVHKFHWEQPTLSFKTTGEKFGITPQSASVMIRFVDNHKNDLQCEFLSKSTHESVLSLARTTDLTDPQRTRSYLVNKYKAKDLNGAINTWPSGLTASEVRKLLDAFGIEWFELDGVPYVHWNET